MQEITIGDETYFAHASLEEADEAMNAQFGVVGKAWRDSDDDDEKGRALVTSSNLLDSLTWAAGYDTDPAWQAAIVQANIQYAAALFEGSFVDAQTQDASGIKILKAGSALIEYFKSFKTKSPATTLPPVVFGLIGKWLIGASGTIGLVFASGTKRCSDFLEDYRQRF